MLKHFESWPNYTKVKQTNFISSCINIRLGMNRNWRKVNNELAAQINKIFPLFALTIHQKSIQRLEGEKNIVNVQWS